MKIAALTLLLALMVIAPLFSGAQGKRQNLRARTVTCGDGFVDDPEECDCGSEDPTCALPENACCIAAGQANECTIKSSGVSCATLDNTKCRAASTCNGTHALCPPSPLANGTICRVGDTTSCRATSFCDGGNMTCDTFNPSPLTTKCHTASTTCDTDSYCTGASLGCPESEVQPLGTICRNSTNLCDKPELCDGETTTCPADGYYPANTLCRLASTACEQDAKCTGSSATCPANSLQSNTTPCRTNTSLCDVVEYCDGTTKNCPTDAFQASTVVCLNDGSVDACALEVTCTGTSAVCNPIQVASCCGNGNVDPGEDCDCGPDDPLCQLPENMCCTPKTEATKCRFRLSNHTCDPSPGGCAAAGMCSGNSSECSMYTVRPFNYVCRAENTLGACDIGAKCDGVSFVCPTNVTSTYRNSTHVCYINDDETQPCGRNVTCSGSSYTCNTTMSYHTQNKLCRAATDICDKPEYCTGKTYTCPVDGYYAEYYTCKQGVPGTCEGATYCDGSSPKCPEPAPLPAGYVCDTTKACSEPKVCDGRSFHCPASRLKPAGVMCRGVAGPCDQAEFCNGMTDDCPPDMFYPDDKTCRPYVLGKCDIEEFCTGQSAQCPPDSFHHSTHQCRPSKGPCDKGGFCSGAADKVCLPNVPVGPSVMCRQSAGGCDSAEYCPSNSTECPPDSYLYSGSLCRNPVGPCDAPEHCTGDSAECPSGSVPDYSIPDLCGVCHGSNTTCVFGCVRTFSSWAKISASSWPSSAATTFSVCSKTWGAIASGASGVPGGVWRQLAAQFITARLNVLAKASLTTEVESAIHQGYAILAGGCTGLSGVSATTADGLIQTLTNYNAGKTVGGPPACSGSSSSTTPNQENANPASLTSQSTVFLVWGISATVVALGIGGAFVFVCLRKVPKSNKQTYKVSNRVVQDEENQPLKTGSKYKAGRSGMH